MSLPRKRVAIIGLPAVGKSTFVHALHGKAGEQQPAPTAGCNKSSVHFDRIIFDLLDLGGSPQVRKFWGQLAGDAHAIAIMVNASEADDMSWALLANEVRRLRAGRPLLVLLNQRDVPAAACVAAADALDRLGIDPAPDVRVAGLLRASDIASAEAGLAWLAALMLGEYVEDDAPPEDDADGAQPEAPLWAAAAQALDEEQAAELQSGMAASDSGGDSPLDPRISARHNVSPEQNDPRQQTARSRLRVMQAVETARQASHRSDDGALAAALASKLASGHLLSSEEIARLRASHGSQPS